MTEKVIQKLTREAYQHRKDILAIPHSFNGMKGYELDSSGDVYFIKWTDKKRLLNGRSRSPTKFKIEMMKETQMRFTTQSWLSSELVNHSIEEC